MAITLIDGTDTAGTAFGKTNDAMDAIPVEGEMVDANTLRLNLFDGLNSIDTEIPAAAVLFESERVLLQQASPNGLKFDLAQISVGVDGIRYTTIGTQTYTVNAGDTSNARYDILTLVPNTGSPPAMALGYHAGTPAANPTVPATPVGELLVAVIFVPANADGITILPGIYDATAAADLQKFYTLEHKDGAGVTSNRVAIPYVVPFLKLNGLTALNKATSILKNVPTGKTFVPQQYFIYGRTVTGTPADGVVTVNFGNNSPTFDNLTPAPALTFVENQIVSGAFSLTGFFDKALTLAVTNNTPLTAIITATSVTGLTVLLFDVYVHGILIDA